MVHPAARGARLHLSAICGFSLAGLMVVSLAACSDAAGAEVSSPSETPIPKVTRSLGPDDVPTSDRVWPTPDLPCGTALDAKSVPELVGLGVEEATQRAKELNYEVRIVGADGKCGSGTDDLNYKRANLYSEDDRVIWAKLY